MSIRDLVRSRRPRTQTPVADLPGTGPLVVGYTGSPTSARAVAAVCRRVRADTPIVLVCAIEPIHPPGSATVLHDALKADAYLLSERASIDEILRRGVELAHELGRSEVSAVAVEGNPVRVLERAAREHGAVGVVVGMRADRPSGQVRHIARGLPQEVALWVTNGEDHIRMVPEIPDRVGVRRPMVPAVPRIARA